MTETPIYLFWEYLFRIFGTCLAKGFFGFFNLRDLISYLNEELHKIANRFWSNKMALNRGKTKFMIFRTRGKPSNEIEIDCHIAYNSTELGHETDP
jgi:hypothetical protein